MAGGIRTALLRRAREEIRALQAARHFALKVKAGVALIFSLLLVSSRAHPPGFFAACLSVAQTEDEYRLLSRPAASSHLVFVALRGKRRWISLSVL
jgi:hypothetical protein